MHHTRCLFSPPPLSRGRAYASGASFFFFVFCDASHSHCVSTYVCMSEQFLVLGVCKRKVGNVELLLVYVAFFSAFTPGVRYTGLNSRCNLLVLRLLLLSH
uniref:Uncharacterized protein n=1 Tax=Trypanosoma congolense (strain IL3000) TaxID=1068625 RepID=G0UP50_TRYCI|nr:hypothetical protein, unlikely [Trypanosoma congolense IL3000]